LTKDLKPKSSSDLRYMGKKIQIPIFKGARNGWQPRIPLIVVLGALEHHI
jgi:hypothetical protein